MQTLSLNTIKKPLPREPSHGKGFHVCISIHNNFSSIETQLLFFYSVNLLEPTSHDWIVVWIILKRFNNRDNRNDNCHDDETNQERYSN